MQAQRAVFDEVVRPVERRLDDPNGVFDSCFFVDGPGDTGKTLFYDIIIHSPMDRGIGVLSVAWTGISAMLLPDGITSLKAFGLPLNTLTRDNSLLTYAEKLALQQKIIVIWDEASMISAGTLNAVFD